VYVCRKLLGDSENEGEVQHKAKPHKQ